MWQKFKEIPTWGKWLAGLVTLITALGTLGAWAGDGIDKFVATEKERLELQEHHDEDVKNILQHLAEQETARVEEAKRARLSNAHEKLSDKRAILVGEKYANEAERLLIVDDIKRLNAEIRCIEYNECN